MKFKLLFLTVFSLIFAICLSIIPLPDWANWLRPAWVALVVCYWVLRYPDDINIGTAWLVGLLLDALYGTILGEHALALLLVAYIAHHFQRIISYFPIWQQSVFLLFLCFIYSFILYLIQWSLGQGVNDWHFWIAPFLSLIIWPVLYKSLFALEKKFRVY